MLWSHSCLGLLSELLAAKVAVVSRPLERFSDSLPTLESLAAKVAVVGPGPFLLIWANVQSLLSHLPVASL